MKENYIDVFRKQFNLINKLFGHEEFTNAKAGELEDIFYKTLSDVLLHSFELQASREKLTELINRKETDKTVLAQFIVESIENEKTYILLNYVLCQFILRYFDIVKNEKKEEFLQVITAEGLTQVELQSSMDEYKKLIVKNNISSSIT